MPPRIEFILFKFKHEFSTLNKTNVHLILTQTHSPSFFKVKGFPFPLDIPHIHWTFVGLKVNKYSHKLIVPEQKRLEFVSES